MNGWTNRLKVLAATAVTGLSAPAFASTPAVEIAFEKLVLDNGLRVIVHEDNKAPVVAVAVWYHVGSKNEPAGRTGFAHLFEHLMFEGTENYDSEYTEPFEKAGAIQQNGTTWFDRTNYFETVPVPALDMALWMESERMGHLLGAVTQEKLDQERAVVKNEKREGDNQPYGTVGYLILEGLFPPGHPYRHDAIGSMEDLDAASLEDIHQWFEDYYGAANAVLVLAGDITPQQGLALAERYFGDIEPGPPVTRMEAWVPERRNDTHEVMVDEVPHTRTYLNWAVPGRTTHDRALLDIAASVLGDGKNSRLYMALILETQQAVEVSVEVEPHQLASMFSITVTLSPDADLEGVVAIVDDELDRLFEFGPGEEELARAKAKFNANLVRGLEHVGGFTGKAAVLASGELYDGRPDFYQTFTAWINGAQTEEVQAAALRWLASGRYRLDVLPTSDRAPGESQVDRSAGIPPVGELPQVRFPAVERASLENGIEVVLAQRASVPLVNVSIQFDAGYAADLDSTPGTSAFTLAMMEESTASRTALEVEALAESLGAEIHTSANLDTSSVNLSALSSNLAESIELLADVTRNPAFAQDEMERQQQRWLAGIQSELSDPLAIALRTLPPLMYGQEHPYGIPFTGSGTITAIAALERSDLEAFYRQWLRPDNATIFVVGDTSLEGVVPLLEKNFGNWRAPRRPLSDKELVETPLPQQSRIFLVDRPGSPQSLILAGHLAPPTGSEDNLEVEIMNDILGGGYNARANQNIRVDKGWAYGAYTFLQDARGQRPWMVYAPVQSDKTTDAVAELIDMIEAFRSADPATQEELQRSIAANTNSLSGQYETIGAVMAALLDNQRFVRPDDYVNTLKPRFDAISLDAVRTSASNYLHPDKLTWVIVGDLEIIKPGMEALVAERGLGEILTLEIDGG